MVWCVGMNISTFVAPNILNSSIILWENILGFLFLFQILVALGPLLLTVNFGMISGYSAILLPQLQLNNSSTIEIDTEEASWIGKI